MSGMGLIAASGQVATAPARVMKSRRRPQAELAVQMIACRTLAETHSLTTTVAMIAPSAKTVFRILAGPAGPVVMPRLARRAALSAMATMNAYDLFVFRHGFRPSAARTTPQEL